MASERIFPDVQREAEVRMNSDPFFQCITVINYRKGDVAADMASALGGITPKNGRSGACVVIQQPVGKPENRNVLFPPVRCTYSFLVAEYPLFNDDANTGTGIRAEIICEHLLNLFSLFQPQGVTNAWVPFEEFAVPVPLRIPLGAEDMLVPVAYECRFEALRARDHGLQKPALPEFATINSLLQITSSTISISCATGAVDIYYTLDGSPPGPPAVSPGSTRYDGTPFAPGFSCVVRAVAMRQQVGSDWIPSDVAWAEWDVALAENQGLPLGSQDEGGRNLGV